ncbi:monovalent cation/H+ antiporter complex subunit F [Jannaschia seohaensis]|uniref:Multicomponent Na+:H+ antiporter subunit F n=1 Tax=Jannaschia seohaensis TaxID=475081 RepID=A0A2Y9B3V9_9RHOB|nr:cation:proton antiporter [Jannaschia seohaensis]PWJ12081.1 multicomponent Na+:H+ antiporter subunit F [Jannaschia seohaensis]SSA51184.1 multicomponent Na+:H+ antiporter subunit F [Jannaschia seohaensis]
MNETVTAPLSATMPILAFAVQVGFLMVMAGIVLAFVRLAKGPSLPDRVVALDTMTVLIVAFCGLFVFESGATAFLDVAVVLALVGFLATVALARFVERKADRADVDRVIQPPRPEPTPDIEELP